MYHQSAVESAAVETAAPELRAIPSVTQNLSGLASERSVVLGGPQSSSLPAFTVSTRLRGRRRPAGPC